MQQKLKNCSHFLVIKISSRTRKYQELRALTLRKDSGPICFSNIWMIATFEESINQSLRSAIKNNFKKRRRIQREGEMQSELTDFHDLILPNRPMHCVPYKSLQAAERLKAVAPP